MPNSKLLLTLPAFLFSVSFVLGVDEPSPLTRRPVVEYKDGRFYGIVKRVTTGEITVEGAGSQPRGPDRHGALTFSASSTLRDGRYEVRHQAKAWTYGIRDVQVGDRVFILYDRIDEADVCACISIQRRPGGRVPPAPGEKTGARRPHHERMNAEQDWEEKGIPIPDRLCTPYELELRYAVPMPRLVNRKAPAAKE